MGINNYSYVTWYVNRFYPICRILRYPNGCYQTIRAHRETQEVMIRPALRKDIRKMSDKSRKRLMFTINATSVKFCSMLTLTYGLAYPFNGAIVKDDVNAIAQRLRDGGYNYIWFLEFQKRGAPHVHFLIDAEFVTPAMRADFAFAWVGRIARSRWFREAFSDDSYMHQVNKLLKFNLHDTVWIGLYGDEGAKWYCLKYASKRKQKEVPVEYKNVGRFWGCSKAVAPKPIDEIDVDEELVRYWLERNGHLASSFDILPKYLWGVHKEVPDDNA